jgi:SAM-dependent methyltransferase
MNIFHVNEQKLQSTTMIRSTFVLATLLCSSDAFTARIAPRTRYSGRVFGDDVILAAGGGFGTTKQGGGGGGKKMKESEKKKMQAKLLEAYGGDIAKGTEERIQAAMSMLPPDLQLAAKLYKQIQQWEARLSNMSSLAQASIPRQEVDGAIRAKEELASIYKANGLDDTDMHNFYQRTTWDASADAKSARAVMFNMNKDLEKRVDIACSYVAEVVKKAGATGRALDVGCGPGVLVPHLLKAGLTAKQITGTDLSPGMIRNAQLQHRGIDFIASDFIKVFDDKDGFDGIIFCSALHDMPDQRLALQKARALLRPGGKMVILHAQGAEHVLGQVKANPVMVRKGLPSNEELNAMNLGLKILVPPPQPGSKEDVERGYLAVLSCE